jgi:Gnt-I system high-affinity gluconate transporter
MLILTILFCILLLVLLIAVGKFHAFLAFLITAFAGGLLLGIPIDKLLNSVQKGIGDTLGSLTIIIILGAMLGKLVAESGAAQRITETLMGLFGVRYIPWALMVTGFIVGIPLFYNVGFVLMVPLIFSVVYQYKLPAVYVGLPMLAALSVTHGFLPPHPSPAALVAQFNADMGLTLIYGLILAVPTIIIAGPIFSSTLKNIVAEPLDTFKPKNIAREFLPGKANSFLSSLLPVILLIAATILLLIYPGNKWLLFFGDPSVVMIIAVLVASFTLGIMQQKGMKQVMNIYAESVKDISIILLIVAGAGALKQVFTDSGVSAQIADLLIGLNMNPLLLGWLMASVIRVCVGSATVAGLTTAGIIAPLLIKTGADPNLMVLSIGAGSLMFSHVNDPGFWMYKEYFNLSMKDTIKSWSVMETIVAVCGLIGVLLLQWIIT